MKCSEKLEIPVARWFITPPPMRGRKRNATALSQRLAIRRKGQFYFTIVVTKIYSVVRPPNVLPLTVAGPACLVYGCAPLGNGYRHFKGGGLRFWCVGIPRDPLCRSGLGANPSSVKSSISLAISRRQ